jgi:hypothetical protein
MTTKRKRKPTWRGAARERADAVGASIVETKTGSLLSLVAEAPAGFRWSDGSGAHDLRCETRVGIPADYDAVWQDLAQRIAFGVERCDCDDCVAPVEEPPDHQRWEELTPDQRAARGGCWTHRIKED